jgi:hypothetical protein
MVAPSHGVGRGNFKLKLKRKIVSTIGFYSEIKYHHAIRDVRIELCVFCFVFSFENADIGAGNFSKVPKRKSTETIASTKCVY